MINCISDGATVKRASASALKTLRREQYAKQRTLSRQTETKLVLAVFVRLCVSHLEIIKTLPLRLP